MIIVPETTDRECIKTNSLSSIGFLAFVTSVVNAVVQVNSFDWLRMSRFTKIWIFVQFFSWTAIRLDYSMSIIIINVYSLKHCVELP